MAALGWTEKNAWIMNSKFWQEIVQDKFFWPLHCIGIMILFYKVHIFWEGHTILRNLHLMCQSFCSLLRIYELYLKTYRVSHSKEGQVILLWWGHRFWFFLVFWFLHVHEIDSFMPNSSVFIFLMFRGL